MGRRGPQAEPFRRPDRPGEWWIRWSEAGPDGKPRRRKQAAGKDRDAAKRLLRSIVEDVERRRLGVGRAVTLSSFAARDLAPVLKARLRPRSYAVVAQRVLAAAAHFKDRSVASIGRKDAEEYLATLKLAPLTIRNYRAALSVAWKLALERGAAHENPWSGLPVPRASERPVPYLSEADLGRIYAAVPIDLRPLVVLLGETGLRLGEALGLRWEDVPADLSRVTVRHSKTGRTRTVPLTETARAVLRAQRSGADPADLVLPGIGEDGILPTAPRLAWKAAVKHCGHASLRVHDLRHARASLLVRAGVPVPTVSRWLGHSTPALVLARYGTHAPENELDQALARLESSRRTGRARRARSGDSASRSGARRGRPTR